METTHYPLDQPGAENFQAEHLEDALDEVAAWLRSNPHVSVLAIGTSVSDEAESITVFYEC